MSLLLAAAIGLGTMLAIGLLIQVGRAGRHGVAVLVALIAASALIVRQTGVIGAAVVALLWLAGVGEGHRAGLWDQYIRFVRRLPTRVRQRLSAWRYSHDQPDVVFEE